jgi:hypothetical protein
MIGPDSAGPDPAATRHDRGGRIMPAPGSIEAPPSRRASIWSRKGAYALLFLGLALGFGTVFDLDLEFASDLADWLPLPIVFQLGLALALSGAGLWRLLNDGRPADNR